MAQNNREDYKALFQRADKDGNGTLCMAEFKEVLNNKGYKEHEIEEYFHAMDENNDGKISYEEFEQAMRAAALGSMLKNVTKEGYGKAVLSELEKLFMEMAMHFM